MAKDLAIILNNGSINSAVATAIAAQKFRPVMLWAELDPAYRACGAGDRQSPIDIRRKDAKAKVLPPLVFNYRASPLAIIDKTLAG